MDLEHVPDVYQDSPRNMLSKYDDMWDGRHEESKVVKHRIDLTPEVKPTIQRPFRTGPGSPKFVSEKVERMIENGIIEPAQPEWASPVVVLPEVDGSIRFCVD